MSWQKIESAPRDGTMIFMRFHNHQPSAAFWSEHSHQWFVNGINPNARLPLRPKGWKPLQREPPHD